MKITFKDVLSKQEWLHIELMNSLTGDVIVKASNDRFYEVKLLVNGIELEPKFFNDLVNNIGKYIDAEAEKLAAEKIAKISERQNILLNVIDEAIYKIKDEFNINTEDY